MIMADNASRIRVFLEILDIDPSQIYTGVMINCSKEEIGLYTSFNKRQIDYAYIHKYKIPLIGNTIWAKASSGGWWNIFAIDNTAITTEMTISMLKNLLNVISLTCNKWSLESINYDLFNKDKDIFILTEDAYIGKDTIITNESLKHCVKGMLFEYDSASGTLFNNYANIQINPMQHPSLLVPVNKGMTE
jgi:hypothetical protein